MIFRHVAHQVFQISYWKPTNIFLANYINLNKQIIQWRNFSLTIEIGQLDTNTQEKRHKLLFNNYRPMSLVKCKQKMKLGPRNLYKGILYHAILRPQRIQSINLWKVSIDIKMVNPWPHKDRKYRSKYSVVSSWELSRKKQSKMRHPVV